MGWRHKTAHDHPIGFWLLSILGGRLDHALLGTGGWRLLRG
jgi:hypothetical protein